MSEEISEICPLAEDDFDFNDFTLESEDDSSWIESIDMNQWKSHFKFNELLVKTIIEDLLRDNFSLSRQPNDGSFSFESHKYLNSMDPSSDSEKDCYLNLPGTELQFGVGTPSPQ